MDLQGGRIRYGALYWQRCGCYRQSLYSSTKYAKQSSPDCVKDHEDNLRKATSGSMKLDIGAGSDRGGLKAQDVLN